jgi:complement component 1 Q subcomponent-binding protein
MMRSVISKSNVFARQINGKASLVARALSPVYPAVSRSPLQSKFGCASAVRHFSATSDLHELLIQEVTHEMTKVVEIDQEFLDCEQSVESLGFVISDDPGTGTVRLTRTYKGETIEVKWDCQNESEAEGQGFDLNELSNTDANPSNETADEGPEFGINFEVCITKGDDKLLFDCISSQRMKIENVQFFPVGVKVNDENVYGGPRFDELEEKVQDSFYGYLSERGVDSDINYYILSKSALKEQQEYTYWLNQIVSFTS